MAVILASPTFTLPGTVKMLAEDGQWIEKPFKATFRRLPQSERLALEQRMNKGSFVRLGDSAPQFIKDQLNGELKNVKPLLKDSEFLDHVFVSLEIEDAEGKPQTAHAKSRKEFFEALDGLEQDVVLTYLHAIKNRPTQEKNSAAPSSTTSAETAQTTES